MATLQLRRDRARTRSTAIRRRIGDDIRSARLGLGISISTAAAAVGLSSSVFARIERGDSAAVTVEQLCLASAAIGLRFSGSAHPDAPGVRDAGHTRLLQRFRDQLPPGTPWRTEVGMPIAGDLRAWDATVELMRQIIAIEAEMRVVNAQAVDRRVNLKRRDSGIEIVILLVADTKANRATLASDREALRANFPLDSRQILSAIRAGRPPASSGVLLLEPSRTSARRSEGHRPIERSR
jgi:transcriptional regulator with XRE-family HTH domain